MWTGNNVTRPLRVAGAAALAPFIDKFLKKTQKVLKLPNQLFAFMIVVASFASLCFSVVGVLILSRWGKQSLLWLHSLHVHTKAIQQIVTKTTNLKGLEIVDCYVDHLHVHPCAPLDYTINVRYLDMLHFCWLPKKKVCRMSKENSRMPFVFEVQMITKMICSW